MPGESKIEWTDASWNPVVGCTKVSRGCDHCYAETFAERFRGVPGHAYEQGFDLRLWPERLDVPIRWTKPRRIFVNSMSDLFHANVPTEFIDRVWAVMSLSPRHTFQVLTKRPQRMQRYLSDPGLYARVLHAAIGFRSKYPALVGNPISDPAKHPHPNIWVGTSVEDQEAAFRINWLVDTPAAVRFLSCEPLLGPVDLTDITVVPAKPPHGPRVARDCLTGYIPAMDEYHRDETIQWVIAGGESGPGARPCATDWLQLIGDQCRDAGVPFFCKQLGAVTAKAFRLKDRKGGDWDEWPEWLELKVREFPAIVSAVR